MIITHVVFSDESTIRVHAKPIHHWRNPAIYPDGLVAKTPHEGKRSICRQSDMQTIHKWLWRRLCGCFWVWVCGFVGLWFCGFVVVVCGFVFRLGLDLSKNLTFLHVQLSTYCYSVPHEKVNVSAGISVAGPTEIAMTQFLNIFIHIFASA